MNRHHYEIDMEIAYVMDDIKRLESRLGNLKAEMEEHLARQYGQTVEEYRAEIERVRKVERPH